MADPEQIDLTEDNIQRFLLESSLYEYVKFMWPYIESVPLIESWHLSAVCEHLQAVTSGQIPRLILNMPPGTSKSTLISVMWPTWEWARDASVRWLYASYDQKLSIRDAVRGRALIRSEPYQKLWGHKFSITDDTDQKTLYATDKGGYRLATSIAGHGTGQHPDRIVCFPGNECVLTDKGWLRFDELVEEKLQVKVLARNPFDGTYHWRDVTGWHRNPGREVVEIYLRDYQSIRCTLDHMLWTTKGWKVAAELNYFDVLPGPGTDPERGWEERRIRSMELFGADQYTYCITVQNEGNFVVGGQDDGSRGIVAKNCDDPHNAKEAESEVERQAVIDWWDLAMTTRGVSRDARRVIVMQRLHHQDLTAHLLAQGGWDHLVLPMRYEKDRMKPTSIGWVDPRTEEGQLLSPDQFSERRVCEMERGLGAYATASQLQQRPSPREGGMFKIQYFSHRVRQAPHNIRRIRGWDRASSGPNTKGACATAGILMGKDAQGNYFIEDMVYGRWEPDERNEVMRATALRDRHKYGMKYEPEIHVEAEGGSSGRDAWKGVARALNGFRVYEARITGSKDTRAEPLACQFASGNVFLVDNGESQGTGKATWDINTLIQHCLLFKPEGAKRLGRDKDIVDSMSLGYNLLVSMPRDIPLRVVPFGKKEQDKVRLVVCDRDSLPNALIEDKRCLLISLADPAKSPDVEETPPPDEMEHSIQHLLDRTLVRFSDHDYTHPDKDFPIEIAKKVWAFVLRKRQRPWEVIVLQDEGDRRAYSIACGLADALWFDRKTSIYRHGSVDNKAEGEINPYVVDQIKATKNMVPS